MLFLRSQLKTFEIQDITLTEVKNETEGLLERLNCRKEENFLTSIIKTNLKESEEEGYITVENFEKYAIDF